MNLIITRIQDAWKFWSVRSAAAGAVMTTGWLMLPQSARDHFPNDFMSYVNTANFVFTSLLRVLAQDPASLPQPVQTTTESKP